MAPAPPPSLVAPPPSLVAPPPSLVAPPPSLVAPPPVAPLLPPPVALAPQPSAIEPPTVVPLPPPSAPPSPPVVTSAPTAPVVTSAPTAPVVPTRQTPAVSAAQSPLDAALEKLVQGHIAFNNPERMRVGETGEVQAVLAINISADDLMRQLTAAGTHESASLLVSDHMQATLTGGAAFDVSPGGPQSQWISKDTSTTWHWLVTPKLTGPQFLTLSVDAIITINGEKDTRNITTLTRQISVDVAQPHNEEEWFARIKEWAEAFGWGWGVAAAVAAAVAGFWRRVRRWAKPKSKQAGSTDADADHD